jgi:transposase InsO family protein
MTPGKYAFIDQHRDAEPGWDLATLCAVLGVCRSGFYGWRTRRDGEPGPMQARRERLCKLIRKLFDNFRGRYGAPRIHRALLRLGEACDRKTVAALMRSMSLVAKGKRRFRHRTTDSNHDQPIAPNLLQRDFAADAPNRKWVTDLTYVPTDEGWLYLVTVIDLFSRKVVGYAQADHMRAEVCVEALENAARERAGGRKKFRGRGLILHSDRGVQFASAEFRAACRKHGITQSMSGKGDCYDNAVAESFFGTLKTEQLHGQHFATRNQAKLEIFAFIEGFYNPQRMHSTLDYLSPDQFEQQHQAQAA